MMTKNHRKMKEGGGGHDGVRRQQQQQQQRQLSPSQQQSGVLLLRNSASSWRRFWFLVVVLAGVYVALHGRLVVLHQEHLLHADETTSYHRHGGHGGGSKGGTSAFSALSRALAPPPPPPSGREEEEDQGLSSSSFAKTPGGALAAALSATSTASTTNVILFVCNQRYAEAVANSVVSVWFDGGYTGDVAVIVDESHNFTEQDMTDLIFQEHGKRPPLPPPSDDDGESIRTAQDGTTKSNATVVLENDELSSIHIFTVQKLMKSLLDKRGHETYDYLRYAPPLPTSCPKDDHRQAGHSAYYHKLLIYHPTIVRYWDHVLYLDACMTYHLPLMDSLFDLSRLQHPRAVLAALDPWRWRQRLMMKGQLRKFDPNDPCLQRSWNKERRANMTGINWEELDREMDHGEALVRKLVLNDRTGYDSLSWTPYFNSALLLYDTRVVRNYRAVTGGIDSTLLEMMILYHLLGQVFRGGDQLVQSVYWMFLRRDDFGVLPGEFWDNGDVIPYKFIPTFQSNGKRQPQTPQQVLSAFNLERPLCNARPVNTVLYDDEMWQLYNQSLYQGKTK